MNSIEERLKRVAATSSVMSRVAKIQKLSNIKTKVSKEKGIKTSRNTGSNFNKIENFKKKKKSKAFEEETDEEVPSSGEEADYFLSSESENEELSSSEEHENTENKEEPKSGWADSMARILGSNKPKNKKSLLLSRAKKDFEIKTKSPTAVAISDIPIVAKNGEAKILPINPASLDKVKDAKLLKSIDDSQSVITVKAQRKMELELRRKLKEWERLNRVKPDPTSDKAIEMDLAKIATKGVVQLFNAVNLQQKTIKSKLRNVHQSEFKKDKVLYQTKAIFDDSLNKSKGSSAKKDSESEDEDMKVKSEDEDDANNFSQSFSGSIKFSTNSSKKNLANSKTKTVTNKNISGKKPAWKVLQDDYMLNANIKDWDKSSDSE